MQFLLTYDGLLRSSRDPVHQHSIRRAFHPQLFRQWTLEKTLVLIAQKTGIDPIAAQFTRGGFRFVPLVTRNLQLACRLEITMLRPEDPGNVLLSSGAQIGRTGIAGDVDNRVKILFDSLSMPQHDQLKGLAPEVGEDPFFCLLEDDSLVASYEVRTERLLRPVQVGEVDLQITVKVYPTTVTPDNLAFLGGWV